MDRITEKSIGMDGNVFADRRMARRRRTLKGASLSFNRGYGALDCIVRNESDTGALLTFGDAAAVPTVFDLKINGTERVYSAKVRWRSMTNVGVEFL